MPQCINCKRKIEKDDHHICLSCLNKIVDDLIELVDKEDKD